MYTHTLTHANTHTHTHTHTQTPGGDLLWSVATDGPIESSSPAIDSRGVVYCSSTLGHVASIDRFGNVTARFTAGGEIQSSPALSAQRVLFVGCSDGYCYAIGEGAAEEIDVSVGVGVEVGVGVGVSVGEDEKTVKSLEGWTNSYT